VHALLTLLHRVEHLRHSWHELETAESNSRSPERKVGVRAGRKFPTIGMRVSLLGEFISPSI
jgi:hypothetical protein